MPVKIEILKEAEDNNQEQDNVIDGVGNNAHDDNQDHEQDNQEQQSQSQDNTSDNDDDKGEANWIRQLRKENRELKRKAKEQQSSKLQDNSSDELPAKPKISDFDYDAEAFEVELDKWHEKKAQIEQKQQKQKQTVQQQREAFNKKFEVYKENKAKYNDFTEKEEIVTTLFTEQQQGTLLTIAKDANKLVYELGKNEDLAEEIASITDPAQFIAEIARFEQKYSGGQTRKVNVQPERKVNGTAPIKNANERKYEELQAKVMKSGGDMTEVFALRKQLKGK